MPNQNSSGPGFFERLQIAIRFFSRALGDGAFASRADAFMDGSGSVEAKPEPARPVVLPAAVELTPERAHASALALLSMLQREGRFIDFLQDEVSAYPDADVGAAARIVHTGCRKALAPCLTLEPAIKQAEGDPVTVAPGFDAQRVRLTGNVSGNPPFSGSLKHHGWIATSVKFPATSPNLDPRVLAPAEVEL